MDMCHSVTTVLNRKKFQKTGWPGELHLQLPDPLVLTHLLTKWSEHVGRSDRQQVAYIGCLRFRQMLGLDQRPLSDQATEFAEALQAEAEQLLLATSSSGLSGGASEGNKKNGAAGTNAVKAAVLQAGQGQRDGRAGGDPNGNSVDNTTQKLRCKFWQTTVWVQAW